MSRPVGQESAAEDAARRAVAALRAAGASVATAESLTGGLVCAALTAVPGASEVVRGGVVVYATDLKAELGGVPVELLARAGAVSAATATALATAVRRRLGASLGVATTGVAGPDLQEGHPAGTVFVATARSAGDEGDGDEGGDDGDGGDDEVSVVSFTGAARLAGDRATIRTATVVAALESIIAAVNGADSRESSPRAAR